MIDPSLTQVLQFSGAFLAYGGIGTFTAIANYRNLAERHGTSNVSSDDRVGCFFAGLFWFVGIWVVLVGYLLRPKPPPSLLSDAQEVRERTLLRQREDLRLDIMEQENRMAILEFERRRNREIDAS
jgi:hypothetical protein